MKRRYRGPIIERHFCLGCSAGKTCSHCLAVDAGTGEFVVIHDSGRAWRRDAFVSMNYARPGGHIGWRTWEVTR